MGNKVTVTMPGAPGSTLIGYVHPDGVKWLSKNQNTGSSIQLLGAPTQDTNVAVYADQVLSVEPPPAAAVDQVELNPADLRVEAWRKNRGGFDTRADNCCRLTHEPTGITITVEGDEDARSVHAAKAIAMQKLKEELARQASAPSLDQAGLADRVAAVLNAHGIGVRPSICAEVAREVIAAGGPLHLVDPSDRKSKADEFKNRLHGSLNLSHALGQQDLFAQLQRLTQSLSGAKEHKLGDAEVREGLQAAVNLARVAAEETLHAKLTSLLADLASLMAPMQSDADVRDVLQDAANLAHAYGHPELYAKLKRLTSALDVRLVPEQVTEIAVTPTQL